MARDKGGATLENEIVRADRQMVHTRQYSGSRGEKEEEEVMMRVHRSSRIHDGTEHSTLRVFVAPRVCGFF